MNEHVHPLFRDIINSIAQPRPEPEERRSLPYPFCLHPDKCAGKSCCQHDPCCAD